MIYYFIFLYEFEAHYKSNTPCDILYLDFTKVSDSVQKKSVNNADKLFEVTLTYQKLQ